MNELIKQLEPLLEDEELIYSLQVLPEIKKEFYSKGERLIALMDVYKIFIPNKTTIDIYNRLYLSLLASLEKKNTLEEVRLFNDNFIKRNGVIGGLDSFRITGNAGLGKTTSVYRCIEVISKNKLLTIPNSNRVIIPFVVVECPADGSFKGLLYSIMSKIDDILGTTYLQVNSSKSITTDLLLSTVSTIMINHVGVLIIDEVERVANDSIKGTTLINYLTQLINQTNISICFTGNKVANNYFSTKEYMGRRTIGIDVDSMKFDEDFFKFCEILFRYQYTPEITELSSSMVSTLYKFSNGIPSMVISLFVEGQKTIILQNKRFINEEVIEYVFSNLFSNMVPYIDTKNNVIKRKGISEVKIENQNTNNHSDHLFELAKKASDNNVEKMIEYLFGKIEIGYVKV